MLFGDLQAAFPKLATDRHSAMPDFLRPGMNVLWPMK